MKHAYTFKVTWGDTDAAGIVFYPNYYKWMDQATAELFAHAGYPISKLFGEEKTGLPLLETFCQFRSPSYFEDLIEVQSTVVEVKEKIFKVEHVFRKDGQVIASGYELRAYTSFSGSQPKAVPIPDPIRELMTASHDVSVK